MIIEILLIVLLVLVLMNIWFSYRASKGKGDVTVDDVRKGLDGFAKDLNRIESLTRDEFARNREEFNKNSKDTREELSGSFKVFEDSLLNRMAEIANLQKNQLDTFSNQLNILTKTNEEKFDSMTKAIEVKLLAFQEQLTTSAREHRDELGRSLKSFEDTFTANVRSFNDLQKQKFDELTVRQTEMIQATEQKLEKMRDIIEAKLKTIQDDSNQKLEKIRETVDEKLHNTLEKRLGESFKIVSERLELVHKGLGEMQTLATGVGDLKKVLSNVKTRGVLGEFQLENILEQILTTDQYSKNQRTKEGSNAMVEFAVKLPGREDVSKTVWLPIDAKFPTEDYQTLTDAYDRGDVAAIEEAKKFLANRIKLSAKDIRDKYLDPPNTTDFAIMFLPFEGLYAEVLRNTELFEVLQREYKVVITGPTTLSALLNSLQMGFRTLAIEKRSSEVWELLGAVKTEFGNFGAILEKTQKKLKEASNVIEQAGVRSRAIERRLREVQALPKEESIRFLGDSVEEGAEEEKVNPPDRD
jgi:DNA recombination protein RmuC